MIVELDAKAIKDLSKLDKKKRQQIFNKIKMLKNYPNISNCKTLKNFTPPLRLRVGDYRVLFDVNKNMITVYNVKHRKNVYK